MNTVSITLLIALLILSDLAVSWGRVFRLKDPILTSPDKVNSGPTSPPNYEQYLDEEVMDNASFLPRYSLLLQVLIFILCAAGVSAVIILCCMICLHSLHFFSRSTVILDETGVMMYRRNIATQGNHETMYTFDSGHRVPWSPSSVLGMEESNLNFSFPSEEKDLPPAYDDLVSKEETVSSPPPPYTPSFSQEIKDNEK